MILTQVDRRLKSRLNSVGGTAGPRRPPTKHEPPLRPAHESANRGELAAKAVPNRAKGAIKARRSRRLTRSRRARRRTRRTARRRRSHRLPKPPSTSGKSAMLVSPPPASPREVTLEPLDQLVVLEREPERHGRVPVCGLRLEAAVLCRQPGPPVSRAQCTTQVGLQLLREGARSASPRTTPACAGRARACCRLCSRVRAHYSVPRTTDVARAEVRRVYTPRRRGCAAGVLRGALAGRPRSAWPCAMGPPPPAACPAAVPDWRSASDASKKEVGYYFTRRCGPTLVSRALSCRHMHVVWCLICRVRKRHASCAMLHAARLCSRSHTVWCAESRAAAWARRVQRRASLSRQHAGAAGAARDAGTHT